MEITRGWAVAKSSYKFGKSSSQNIATDLADIEIH